MDANPPLLLTQGVEQNMTELWLVKSTSPKGDLLSKLLVVESPIQVLIILVVFAKPEVDSMNLGMEGRATCQTRMG